MRETKPKQNGRLKLVFVIISESEFEIIRIQEEDEKENAKNVMEFDLKVFKGSKRLTDVQISRRLRTCPW